MRFYTFNTTMRYIIEAASLNDIEVWILDRPNPVGGNYVSGWVLILNLNRWWGRIIHLWRMDDFGRISFDALARDGMI